MPEIQLRAQCCDLLCDSDPSPAGILPEFFWGCHQEKAACTSFLSFQGTLGAFTSHADPVRAGKGATSTGQVVPAVNYASRVSPGKNNTAEVGEKRDADPLAA